MEPSELPGYYRHLTAYFPQQELKPLGQFADLFSQTPYYRKLESDQYVLLYAEFPDFLFVDFMLVHAPYRNQRLGSWILDHLRQKRIPIILEVEPPDPARPDTALRRKFYLRHQFQAAPHILYRRKNQQGQPFDMDIFYWSPAGPISDNGILAMMTQVCNSVHNYNALPHYGRLPADPRDVLSLRRQRVLRTS